MRRLSILLLVPALGGCYGLVNGIGSGIDRAAFDFARVVTGAFGVLGVALTLAAALRPVSGLSLALSWLIGLPVIGIAAWSSSFFNPWPGDFRPRELWLFWLSMPLAIAPLVATGRFFVDRSPNKKRGLVIATLAACALYVGALGHTSRAVLPIPFDQKIVEIAVTDSWSYGRTSSGTVVGLGHVRELAVGYRAIVGDAAGALGIDSEGHVVALDTRAPPRRLSIPAPVRAVAVGSRFQCAADVSGRLSCFDAFAPNDDQQRLGFGPTPLLLQGFDAVVEIAVSDALICARSQDGKVRCTAGNPSQRIVSEITASPGAPHLLFEGNAQGVVVTLTTACVIDGVGDVVCDGPRDAPERGPKAEQPRGPRKIPGVEKVRQLVGGSWHLCALQEDGSVRCWGGNGWGQLGRPNQPESLTPERVMLPARAAELFRHRTSTCARLEDGQLFCWGAQRRSGNLLTGRVCESPIFSAPMVCSDGPVPIPQPTSYVPLRPN